MHYKRLQKYGKKLAVAVLTSAVLLASGATVYADDTGEYLSQANTQEAEVTESTEDVATPAESESGEVESTTRNQEEQKNKATESEIQEEGKIQDVSEEQPESEVQIKEEKQPASESAAVPELNEEAQQSAVQSQEAQIAVQTQTVEAPHPGWNQSGGQTYYLDENMNRLTGWRLLGNVWYYFDDQGVMAIGWRWIGGKWYYMNSAGAMQSGWFQDGQTWYYANGSGVMQKGWLNRGGTWYYLTGSGAMAEGWGNIGGTWYYFQPGNGAMQVGWVKDGNIWYYMNGSGAMQRGWLNRGGTWYYLTGSGAMATGWINLGGTWYYLNPGNGDMVGAGWHLINNKWYYFGGSGAMYSNRWIGNYYVGGNGEMLTNTWVGSYWVGADGKWIPNYDPDVNANWVKSGNTWYYQRPDGSKLTNSWKRINGSWYYFGADGAMTTGWKYVDGYKFYFGTDGKMVQDVDKLIGKQSSYRITVNRVKCQVTVYAANETGNYCIPVKTFTCSVGKAGTPTHAGTYATLKKQNPVELMGPSWGKYGTQINNYGDWFHSVACSNPDPTYALAAGNYNMLGQPASHGCVRLCVRDAKWIYDNCGLYTRVDISDTEYTPFDKAPTIKIPASQNWDPTDADAKR